MKNIISFSFILILIYGCKENFSEVSSASFNSGQINWVTTETVEKSYDPIPIHAIGRVAIDKELKLSFKIGGIVSDVFVDEGDYVKKGILLASIRTDEIDAQVFKAERALQKAERDLERVKKMYADSAATLSSAQDLKTQVDVSRADLDIALFNQRYSKVVCPVNGRVIKRMVEPDELVSPGQPIFLIASSKNKSYILSIALSDRDVNKVQLGDPAEVEFDAFPQEEFAARVDFIAESADPMTGTFEVELDISSIHQRLRNGYVGRAKIFPNQRNEYYKIPMDAIVEGDGRTLKFFTISHDSIAKEIQVSPFHIFSAHVGVRLGNERGFNETIITTGSPYLKDGDIVRIR